MLVASNGDWYEGDFGYDKFDGEGQRSDSSGVYTGSFVEGKRHGEGVFNSHGGVKHIGRWRDGVREGEGTQSYPDGSKFEGTFGDDDKSGPGSFVDGLGRGGAGGHEIAYTGSYKEGVRHGEHAEWDGIYGDSYAGGFADGEMRGVGKFTFGDGEEYLGMWLAPGAPGQMPRRMSAMKRHAGSGGGGVSAGLADNLSKHKQRQHEKKPEAKEAAVERVPLALMPEAIHELRGALAKGGLEGGAGRAAGSLAANPMGATAKNTSPRDPMSRLGGGKKSEKVNSHLLAAATSHVNPFAQAGPGVLMAQERPGGGTGFVDHGPPSKIIQQERVKAIALQPADLGGRFGQKPVMTPKPPPTPKWADKGSGRPGRGGFKSGAGQLAASGASWADAL